MVHWTPRQTAALVVLLILLALGSGLALWRKGRAVEDEFVVVPRPAQASPSAPVPVNVPPPAPSEVVVHLAGAVRKSGVLHLRPGTRTDDAIRAAGGAAPDADLDAVNLAARVEDGQQLYIPRKGEAARAPAPTALASGGRAVATGSSRTVSGAGRKKLTKPGEGFVSLNSASADELQRLPGVGPAMAQRILDYRKTIGRFTSPEQLMDVSGIGPKKFDKMKGFVIVK